MRNQRIQNSKLLVVAGLAVAAMSAPVCGQIITSNPNLPPVYPTGVYRMDPVQFNGPGLSIVLTNLELRPFAGGSITNSGPNEIENFNAALVGLIIVSGVGSAPAQATGPLITEAFGKAGNTTGTFNTEMLSMSLSGNTPFGPIMIRESPTLASLGQTSITDQGGGLYRIDSFFDVFTELSIDGGATWMPDSQGPSRAVLGPVPEPSSAAFLLAGILSWAGLRRLGTAKGFRHEINRVSPGTSIDDFLSQAKATTVTRTQ